MARQRSAKPSTAVRFRFAPPEKFRLASAGLNFFYGVASCFAPTFTPPQHPILPIASKYSNSKCYRGAKRQNFRSHDGVNGPLTHSVQKKNRNLFWEYEYFFKKYTIFVRCCVLYTRWVNTEGGAQWRRKWVPSRRNRVSGKVLISGEIEQKFTQTKHI